MVEKKINFLDNLQINVFNNFWLFIEKQMNSNSYSSHRIIYTDTAFCGYKKDKS